jgi:phosphatidylserine/phosphatidylglycerophosphate/cardiolipin synthase-like enzyme
MISAEIRGSPHTCYWEVLVAIEISVHCGADDAFIAWTSDFVPDCKGFALHRKIKRGPESVASPNIENNTPDADGFILEIVASWVGFANGPDFPDGTRKPTTEWPIQKYLWADYMVSAGDTVSYQVVPLTGLAGNLQRQTNLSSQWSPPITIGPNAGSGVSCYFNRGIIASQWLNRLLPADINPAKNITVKNRKLRTIVNTPNDRTRNFLGGPLRARLVALMAEAQVKKWHVFAVLYELDDPELQPLLKALKKRSHIVLGNGSVGKKGEDQNEDARADVSPVCDVSNRMTSPRALAHNKFLVVCDAKKSPKMVWTGSTNWTKTGLCTQSNNALLIENATVAKEYLEQWKLLKKAENLTPSSLKDTNEIPRRFKTAKGVNLFFSPMNDQSDLVFAREKIIAAKQGILFLMFNPGPMGTLLNVISELASPSSPTFNSGLYIQGVLNQNPGTSANPVTLFHRGERIEANADVVLPAAIDERLKFWMPELQKMAGTFAMIHSKIIVVDPFGANPVVMTGSHNMGPKASGTNDENFLIIENNTKLAAAYAVYIMECYNQYRWRFARAQANTAAGKSWNGLADHDKWQIGAPGDIKKAGFDLRRKRELDFWFGRA